MSKLQLCFTAGAFCDGVIDVPIHSHICQATAALPCHCRLNLVGVLLYRVALTQCDESSIEKQVDMGKTEEEEGCTAAFVDVSFLGTEYWANEGSRLWMWLRFAAGVEKISIDS